MSLWICSTWYYYDIHQIENRSIENSDYLWICSALHCNVFCLICDLYMQYQKLRILCILNIWIFLRLVSATHVTHKCDCFAFVILKLLQFMKYLLVLEDWSLSEQHRTYLGVRSSVINTIHCRRLPPWTLYASLPSTLPWRLQKII